MVGGWLLLPPTGISLPGFPDFDKVLAPIAGVILGTFIFQPHRLLAFRLKWFDLPMLLWCALALISSLANGLGVYDGISGVFTNFARWTLPYFIGRLYFGTKEGMRELACGIAIGGMIWVLPCLFEIRMSPILMAKVYGMARYEGTRLGGWRPFVFFTTGLELGMWMTASSLTATWLWWSGCLKESRRYSLFIWCLPVLLITTVLCRASGALALLILGLTTLWLSTRLGVKLLFCGLLLVPLGYYAIRIPNLWSGTQLTDFLAAHFDEERARSLAFRFEKENMLTQKAMEQPVWGWGGWGRSRVVDEQSGRDISTTDGMWIIYLGYHGMVGLLTWTTMLLLPSWLFAFRFSVRQWSDPTIAPLAVLATLLGLYVMDCLLNGFMNPSYVVASGGLAGAVASSEKTRERRGRSAPRATSAAARPVPGHQVAALPSEPSGQSTNSMAGLAWPTTSQERLAERYKHLARTLRAQGQLGEARAMLTHAFHLLSEAARTHPESQTIQKQRCDCANDLAWLVLSEADTSTRDAATATDRARQATEGEPGCATYWNTLGAAYERAGAPTDAITALEQSIALGEGGTAYDYIFLALARNQLGQPDQAAHCMTQAADWMEEHGPCPPELTDLFKQARDQLHFDHKSLHS
jgi:tetratricopeptide (TPR) repeat protein